MRNGQLTELTGDERDAASRDVVARTAYGLWRRINRSDGSPTSARAGRLDKRPRRHQYRAGGFPDVSFKKKNPGALRESACSDAR